MIFIFISKNQLKKWDKSYCSQAENQNLFFKTLAKCYKKKGSIYEI